MKKLKCQKKLKEPRKVFSVECPFCKEEIKGTSLEHLKHNINMHILLKHKGKSEEVEIVE